MNDNDLDRILEFLMEFCNTILIPAVLKSKSAIKCTTTKSDSFNARVITQDCKKFSILINRGVLKSIINLVENIDDKVINEEIESISDELFGTKKYKADILQVIAYEAVIFIVSHELAHVFRGHLEYIYKGSDFKNNKKEVSFSFSEFSDVVLKSDDFEETFIKLAELDADISALHILLQISVELIGYMSSTFDEKYRNWKQMDRNKWSTTASRITFYSSTLALSIIEAKRQNNSNYPLPFTRIMNLFDGYKQDMYKLRGIISYEYSPQIEFLNITDQMKDIEERIALDFMNSVDLMVEGSKILGNDLSKKFGEDEEQIYKKLLYDLLKLSTNLKPDDLETEEGKEYKLLRLYRPKLYSKFSPFIMENFKK